MKNSPLNSFNLHFLDIVAPFMAGVEVNDFSLNFILVYISEDD